jgi:hypothetical protein
MAGVVDRVESGPDPLFLERGYFWSVGSDEVFTLNRFYCINIGGNWHKHVLTMAGVVDRVESGPNPLFLERWFGGGALFTLNWFSAYAKLV